MLEYTPDASGQPPLRSDEVQKLVASGVADLKVDSVSVVMKPVQLLRSQQAYDFVAFGPIVVAAPSLATLKVLTAGFVLILLALGVSLYWNGRVMSELRFQLQTAQRQLRALPKPPKSTA